MSVITDILNKYINEKNIEIEAKITIPNYTSFNFLKKIYNANSYKLEYTNDIFKNKDRFTIINGKTIKTTKTRLESIKLSNSVNIHISKELDEEITPSMFLKSEIPENNISEDEWIDSDEDMKNLALTKYKKFISIYDFKRVKKRWSIPLDLNNRLDLTEVTCNGKTKFECEIEIYNDINEDFINQVKKVKKDLDNYNVVMEWNEWTYLHCDNKKIETSEIPYMNNKVSTPPRPIVFGDMKMGGLIGGETKYSLTRKSDGERRYMIFSKHGIYLVKPMLPRPIIETILNKPMSKLVGIVIDGEYIKHGGEEYFIMFDCLAYNKNSSIQLENHLDKRLKICDIIARAVPNIGKLNILVKKFYKLGDSIYSMRKAFEKIGGETETVWDNDGYILTPINYKYKTIPTSKMKKWGDNRTIVDVPDILKIKPFELSSIDFLIKGGEAFVVNTETKLLERFMGTSITPFSSQNLFIPDLSEVENRIVEFAPKSDIDERPIILEFMRYRDDKDAPNSLFSAQSVWKLLHEPLTVDMILGYKFISMRKLFNKIKEDIFISYVSGDNNILLDIGSGRGSDIQKIKKSKHFTNLLAVEPNRDNLDEFITRMNNMSLGNLKINILNSGGEDTELIIQELTKIEEYDSREVICSMMLSLSFFFSGDDKLFDSLVDTIKMSGAKRFLFMTIEKERLNRVLGNDRKIKLGPVDIEDDDGTVIFDFPGTIVGKQYEWRVDLNRLHEALGSKGMMIKDIDTKDYIMSDEEKMYCSMYVWGYINL